MMAKLLMTIKCTLSSGRFDGHGGLLVQYEAHCLMQQAQGYTRSHSGRCHRATTRSAFPQRPPGQQQTKQWRKCAPLCWPFPWLWWCASTIPCKLPDGGHPGLHANPLDATIGRVLRPIVAIGHVYTVFWGFFSWSSCWNRASDDVKTPFNNRGVTYQTNWKAREDVMEHSTA